MEAVASLKLGVCYFIRAGTASIVDSPWLPTATNYKPQLLSPVSPRQPFNSLRFPNSKIWNEAMVRSIFVEKDANRVLEPCIP